MEFKIMKDKNGQRNEMLLFNFKVIRSHRSVFTAYHNNNINILTIALSFFTTLSWICYKYTPWNYLSSVIVIGFLG